jgi:hypothetical protein
MAIRLLLEHDHAFGPDEIKLLVEAFEAALRSIGIRDRNDPTAIPIAKLIMELAKSGERDPVRLREGAVQAGSR